MLPFNKSFSLNVEIFSSTWFIPSDIFISINDVYISFRCEKMAQTQAKPRSEMSQEELAKREEEEFNVGPLSILTHSVTNNAQVS